MVSWFQLKIKNLVLAIEKILKFDDKKIEDMANQSINLSKRKIRCKKSK